MNSSGISLRQAALVAGFGLLVMVIAAPFAQLYVYPKLIVPEDPAQTFQNVSENGGLFVAAFFGYLITLIMDIVVAWALFVLLAPVNKPFSLLTAWFRVVYAAISIAAVAKFLMVYRMVHNPDFLAILGTDQLHSQIRLAHSGFQYTWSVAFYVFSPYLILLGWLVYKADYIPKIMGILLIINGVGYLLDGLQPFLFPSIDTGFLMITFFGEIIFMLWLFIKGSKLKEPE